jgi:hypothetical protein
MANASLAVKPGVDTQGTPLQVSGTGITQSSLIRFKNNYTQKLGGCTRLINDRFTGIASFLLPWAALNGTEYVGIGTSRALQLVAGGTIVDITPIGGVGSGDWSLDKWGEDLVGAPAGGTVYIWMPPVAPGNIATPVTNAPPVVNGLVVAAPAQQIITWGAYSVTLGAQDPMLVKWNDVSNLTVWTAAVNNQAGSFRIPNGSKIEAILWFGLSGLLWTDLDLWSMTYSGFPLIYGFNKIAPNAGLIARRAVAAVGTRIAWMAQNDFFLFAGGQAQPMTCTVRDFVFNNLDRDFTDAIHADANTYFDEIMWRFPTIGSCGCCDGYVKWNATEDKWDYGFGAPIISAWSDQSVIGAPIGSDSEGLIQQFETAIDFDGEVLRSFFETGWFQLSEGQEFLFLERILPDFRLNGGGEVRITVTVADEIAQDDIDFPVRVYGPYTVTQRTPYIVVRARGRVAKVLIESVAPNTFWRYGKPLAVVSVDGRR